MTDHRRNGRAGFSRRAFIGAAGAGAAVTLLRPATVLAQAYPTRPIKMVVGFAAGGPSDIIARVLGAKLSESLGQQVVVENRTGASGNLATEAVARSDPDGYTLLMTPLSCAVNESLFKGFRIRFDEHLAAIGSLAETALVLVVHPSLNVSSVAELIALAKAKPGEVLYASAGKGTATHLAAELFNAQAGTRMTPVHYRGGGETIKDLRSGEVKVMFSTIPPVLGMVKEGSLRGIATSGPKRDRAFPELPTFTESGLPDYDVRLWFGLTAPHGTPAAIIEQLASATRKVLDTEEFKKALSAQGYDPLPGSPSEFAAFYRGEAAKWAKIVQVVGSIGD